MARDEQPRTQITFRQMLWRASIVFMMIGVGVAWWIAVPYAVTREALYYDGAATIVAGPRDRWFFTEGWSGLIVEGNVTLRLAAAPGADLAILLPEPRSYALTLRANPADPAAGARQMLRVSMNGKPLQEIVLGWNPERIGQYDLTIPAHMFTPGSQRLELRSDAAFKLWYVRIAAL